MQDTEVKTRQFLELYADYRQKLFYFAYSYLRDKMTAEDIVMDSFMHYWEHRDSIWKESSHVPYILATVRNKCLNHLKSQQVKQRAQNEISALNAKLLQTQISSLTACDPQELFAEESRQIIAEAIAGLPEQTREIFIRSRFKDMSYKQIITEMNIPFRTVDYELRKATKMLAGNLKKYFPYLLPILMLFLVKP